MLGVLFNGFIWGLGLLAGGSISFIFFCLAIYYARWLFGIKEQRDETSAHNETMIMLMRDRNKLDMQKCVILQEIADAL